MKKRWGRSSKPEEPRRARDADAFRQTQSHHNQYLRSRTISAYTPAPAPELTRHSVHELLSHRRRLVRILVACIAAIIVLAFLVGQYTADISQLSYTPAVVASPDPAGIKSVVNDYYASRPLERFRFLLNEKTLSQFLASKIPEVKGVESVGIAGLGTSRMSVDLRTPVASWDTGDKTVYVDSDGESFTHNYYSAPAVTVEDQSGAGMSQSSTIASSTMISYIGQLISALKNNGTGTVTKVVLPAGMIRELDIYLQGRAYRIKVQLDRDVPGQASDLKTAVNYIDAHGGAREYIDVRVPGKAYFK